MNRVLVIADEELSPKGPNTAESSASHRALRAVPDVLTEPSQTLFTAKSSRPPLKPTNRERREREYLTQAEVSQLIDAAKKTGRYGTRDGALILLAYRHALRVGELVDLRWEQIDFASARIHINRLKNGDPSVHYLEGDELRVLRKLQRATSGPFVFSTERLGPLSTRHVRTLVARAGIEAGLTFPAHPHMLRHAKGYQLANKGIDTRAIQGYMGHKNIQHTVGYTHLSAERFKGFGKDL
ncbi:MAG TPA: tyrosine-type recombinase/integrase [Drouetiella sp.]